MLVYFLLLLLTSLFTFSFLLFILSEIPFYPTNKKDLSLIVKTLLDQRPDLVVDLGAGTGTVIFAVASQAFKKKPKAKFLAVEIHPLLTFIMRLKRLFHPNKKNIKIKRADIFKFSHSAIQSFDSAQDRPFNPSTSLRASNLTLYLYVNRQSLKKLKPELTKLTKDSTIISYMYDIPGWEKKLTKTKRGVSKIFIYRI